jgi:predicted N-acetyltransferase YhbS
VRAGVDWLPALSFAAVDGAKLVGSVLCWPVALTGADGSEASLILLGPVAVDPARSKRASGDC